MKRNVPTKENAKLKIICWVYVTFVINNIEIKIPSFAASSVPAVVGGNKFVSTQRLHN
ncbi:hypothetical protein JCM21714_1844 [Gracilibacillus boraciitolerans JCM 21714]|uniref:Uncharacterized protein n=1 Tax=Gracilibacillus boraciitolerans JCM 21714 TaxID=1298598 RepID=W4VJ79_9BACI|nr:hypothetical protein JCM21714_1844 [Gracilibacillus boraciitolerans JCM 21714]